MSQQPSGPGQLQTGSRDSRSSCRLIGLTGGIASGKSLAARFFKEVGIPVIDADQIARELSREGGAAYPAILKRFGTADRRELRKLVFADPQARRDLEAILHPLIEVEMLRRISELKAPVVLYEAALLVETKRYETLDGLILIDAPKAVRRQRLIQRDGIPENLADQMLSAQASDEERRAAATIVIENTGTADQLRTRIEDVARDLKYAGRS